MTKTKQTPFPAGLIDELLKTCPNTTQEDLFGPNGLVKQFSKALIERSLQAEMSTHAGLWRNTSAEQKRSPTIAMDTRARRSKVSRDRWILPFRVIARER